MKTVGVFEAKTHFSALIERVQAGDTVLVTKHGVPVARIVPVVEALPRPFGVARHLFDSGAIVVHDDFDAPLPEALLAKLNDS
jgi:prevent-host-death family protein